MQMPAKPPAPPKGEDPKVTIRYQQKLIRDLTRRCAMLVDQRDEAIKLLEMAQNADMGTD